MANIWQNKLKEAERALNLGEVDHARKLLADSQVRRSPAGQELAGRVVKNIAERAERNVSLGNSTAGWRDLEYARALAGDAAEVLAAREKMISVTLEGVEKLLQASDTDAALAKLNRLHEHNIAGGRVATMRQVVLKARRAERLAQFGKFDEAAREWKSAKELRGDMNVLDEREAKCRNVAPKEGRLAQQLQQALSDRAWNDALDLAGELLNLAPQHPLARDARDEAWKRVGEKLTDSERLRRTAPWRFANPARANRSFKPELPEGSIVTGPGKCENRRLQLWIDAVGGYLVCLADEIEIGQAAHGTKVDIPVFGNLSHVHARVRRDGEGYIISPEGKVLVAGRELIGPSFLTDGDEIQLGEVVRYRFRRPHALSASARLEPLSGHRTQPPSDAILLMAESCVLGPRLSNHVVCRDWTDDVILFRQEGEIHCRTNKEIEIDGRLCDGEGPLAANSHVCGEDFSLSVEET
jgi:hypothetical protein